MARSRAAVTESFINGWRAVRLASDTIGVTVLPDKGADIFALVDLAAGLDPLFKAPWGLAPPGAAPRDAARACYAARTPLRGAGLVTEW